MLNRCLENTLSSTIIYSLRVVRINVKFFNEIYMAITDFDCRKKKYLKGKAKKRKEEPCNINVSKKSDVHLCLV